MPQVGGWEHLVACTTGDPTLRCSDAADICKWNERNERGQVLGRQILRCRMLTQALRWPELQALSECKHPQLQTHELGMILVNEKQPDWRKIV